MLKIGNILYVAAAISNFCRFSVFFRGNYFFQVLAPLSVYMGSHPPGVPTWCLSKMTFARHTSVHSEKQLNDWAVEISAPVDISAQEILC